MSRILLTSGAAFALNVASDTDLYRFLHIFKIPEYALGWLQRLPYNPLNLGRPARPALARKVGHVSSRDGNPNLFACPIDARTVHEIFKRWLGPSISDFT